MQSSRQLQPNPQEINYQCRICLQHDQKPMISPCNCTGSAKYVHLHCLQIWINIRNNLKTQKIKDKNHRSFQIECQICKKGIEFDQQEEEKCIQCKNFAKQKLWCALLSCILWIIIFASLSGFCLATYVGNTSDFYAIFFFVLCLIILLISTIWFTVFIKQECIVKVPTKIKIKETRN